MSRKGALEGLKVLDLTRVLAGPFCTMMFADMGAEIIKVEQAGKGDDTRHMGPFKEGESAYFMNLNRNKKGITLNLKDPRGKAIFLDLVKKADVVIENFRPGTMEKLGLGYEELKKVNPGLVYGAISGFGHTGRYSQKPGYDIISQAMSGLMSTTGWPGGEPTRTGTAMGDVLGGLSCAIGILAAVYNKIQTGEGQKVDVALVDSAVASLEIINMIYLVEGRVPTRIGNRYESTYPYDSFRGSDGSLVIGAGNDKLWVSLCKVMGRPELAEDPRYLHVPDRVARHEELKEIVEEWTMKRTVDEIYEMVDAAGIPCAPIYDIAQVANDPHIAGDREMFVDLEHPVAGKMKVTGAHIKLSGTPPTLRTPSPALGQHNDEVLAELLGYPQEKISELREEGVI
ncbi:MAG: CaiB/BaiF CoA transferase family protein [Aminivibrio sp.]|jgi:crotonobetainyl-CoA:carnitine CoA-transferase CaiB-like acyl-CoA transferase